jgi:hypothetical protein
MVPVIRGRRVPFAPIDLFLLLPFSASSVLSVVSVVSVFQI